MTKEQLIELWSDIRTRAQLEIHESTRIEQIAADANNWVVSSGTWKRRTPNVVLALGRRGAPNKLGVPGEELPHVAYRLLEPEAFVGKRVLVVGGGNAAADCVIALAEAKVCRSVGLSYRRNVLARLRTLVRNKVEALISRGDISTYFGTEVVAIHPTYVELNSSRGRQEVPADEVIVQIGGSSPSALLKTIGIELVEKRGAA